MQGYRKSKKGEINCERCLFYHVHPLQKRGRCGGGFKMYSAAVGKTNTCDAAEKKEQILTDRTNVR